jgi:probable F420-dependent oxidoreductase
MELKVDYKTGYHFSISEIKQKHGFFQQLESIGYNGISIAENPNDPFPALSVAAYESQDLEVRTAIALAFSRSPMSMAYSAHEINVLAEGRFTLGLGSQIKAHIERRFSMPWLGAAQQMREYIQALNAIYDCWYNGEPLNYEGDFYRHNLMPPDFIPNNLTFGRPRTVLAAVGPLMIKVAAGYADGIIVHPFCTSKYLHDYIIPLIEKERLYNGRGDHDFEISFSPFIVTGDSEQEFQKSIEDTRQKIAFYGSTPAYKRVLEIHNLEHLHKELHYLSKNSQWDVMSSLIDDETLRLFACVGEQNELPLAIKTLFQGKIHRTSLTGDIYSTSLQHQLSHLKTR